MTDLFKTHSLALKAGTTKTIATGVITADQMYHVVAAETGTTDDLATISIGYDTVTVNSVTYRPMLILVADSGDTITLKHGTGNIQLAAAVDMAISGNDKVLLFYDGTNWNDIINSVTGGGGTAITGVTDARFMQARLTLTTGVSVTTSDVTAATTLYWTPHGGNLVSLYDGADYKPYVLTEKSIVVPATTNTLYDVYGYLSGGVPTLELVAWTNDTTRATAIALHEGWYAKSGDATRTFLGKFRTTGVSGQTEDSLLNPYLCNHFNPVQRKIRYLEPTNSWSYTTGATWRKWNAGSPDINFLMNDGGLPVWAFAQSFMVVGAGVTAANGIGLDSSTVNSADIASPPTSSTGGVARAEYEGFPSTGKHTLSALEYTSAAAGITNYGDGGSANNSLQSGLEGFVWG